MTTRLLIQSILLLLICISPPLSGEEQQSEENLLKAVFIYNFAKFTRWPEETWPKNRSSLKICSFGDDDLAYALLRLDGRKLKNHPVTIEQREENSLLDGCHVLYLANTLANQANNVAHLLRFEPILTVSEITDFSKSGGMIELYHINGKIRFKINLQAVREAGLDLSSRLLKLADIVHTGQ